VIHLTFFNHITILKQQFTKYHGAGNDFIMVDGRKNVMPAQDPATIETMCDRHFGIGADGVIILRESENVDFKMDYFNSDGYPGTMCGNGGRCITVFAKQCGVISQQCTFEAADGLHRAEILPNGGVKLELGDVRNIQHIPEGYLLDTGSPHLVIFVDELESLDVFAEGRKMREDQRFAGGTNVNFVKTSKDGIEVRTYERGVEDETLSCGTGVTASAIASYLHTGNYGESIDVRARGGMLNVSFVPGSDANSFGEVFLTGPVTRVFDGSIDI